MRCTQNCRNEMKLKFKQIFLLSIRKAIGRVLGVLRLVWHWYLYWYLFCCIVPLIHVRGGRRKENLITMSNSISQKLYITIAIFA